MPTSDGGKEPSCDWDEVGRHQPQQPLPPPRAVSPRRPEAEKRTAVWLSALVAALYVVSFFLPALYFHKPEADYYLKAPEGVCPGWGAFVMALLTIVYIPTWLANPLCWLAGACLLQRRWRWAAVAGSAAVLLSLSQCWTFHPDRALAGYYLWVASMAAAALAGWYGAWAFPAPRGR